MANWIRITGITGSTPTATRMTVEFMFEGMEVNGWSRLYNGNVISNDPNTQMYVGIFRTSPGGDTYRVTLYDANDKQIGQGTYVVEP